MPCPYTLRSNVVPHLNGNRYIIAGKDGSDAKPYLEKQVNEALEELNKIEAEGKEEPES